MSDIIDFDALAEQQDADTQAELTRAVETIASLNASAVMPDGSTLGRAEILERLGLNPNTSPTAWLTAVVCGFNASALRPGDLQRVAATRISTAAQVLRNVQSVQGVAQAAEGGTPGGTGFEAGGKAPG